MYFVVIKTAKDATVNVIKGGFMSLAYDGVLSNEEKIPVALEAIWLSLERIAEAIEKATEQDENCACNCHD